MNRIKIKIPKMWSVDRIKEFADANPELEVLCEFWPEDIEAWTPKQVREFAHWMDLYRQSHGADA
jgi:hypothetical protein